MGLLLRKCGLGTADFLLSLTLALQVSVLSQTASVEYSSWMGGFIRSRRSSPCSLEQEEELEVKRGWD